MDVLPFAVPAAVALVVAFLTSRLTLRREARSRAVASRRTAVVDVQQSVVRFRVARQRYGDELARVLAARTPGASTQLGAPDLPADVRILVFEAETVYAAALARLDAQEAALGTAAKDWAAASLLASMSDEVDSSGEQDAFDRVNEAVRVALASVGA